MKRLIIGLGMALTILATPLAASPESETAERGDAGFYDSHFRSWVGMAGYPSSNEASFRSAVSTGSYTCSNISAGGDRTVRYPFSLPDSRRLDWVRVWGNKAAGTTDLTLRLRRSCMTQSQTVPNTETLATQTLTDSPGEFSLTLQANGHVPNSLSCKYWLDVNFGPSSEPCAQSTTDYRIYKVRVQSRISDRIFRHGFRVHAPN